MQVCSGPYRYNIHEDDYPCNILSLLELLFWYLSVAPIVAVGRARVDVYLISTIVALGGVLFGFDLVIISGTVSFFANHFQLSGLETGWAVSCINLGAAIGAVIGGRLSDTLGRKNF